MVAPTSVPYCDEYGGLVLNATIDKYAYASIEDSSTGDLEVVSADRLQSQVVKPPTTQTCGMTSLCTAGSTTA